MKIRHYCFIVLILLFISFFFPKLLIVHYQNPQQPIAIYLQQNNNRDVYKDLADGSQFFILNRGFSMWSNDFAYLGWYWQSEKHVKNRHEGFLSFLGEKDLKNSDLDLTVCRVHLYLDKNAQIVRREVKYPIFLNLCI